MTRGTRASLVLLVTLMSLVLVALLFAPTEQRGQPYSSYSAGLNGVRLARDLASRLGWPTETREVPFSDTLASPARVQVLVNAGVAAGEVHALLEFARAGGSILVAGASGPLADSLFVVAHESGVIAGSSLSACPGVNAFESAVSSSGRAAVIGFRRPMPDDTVGFGLIRVDRGNDAPAVEARAAVGLPFGAGRIVVVADGNYLVNEAVRRCELGVDVAYVRMLEYLTRGRRGERIAFDEFHHGYGARGGSLAAIRMYLAGTPSGRMLAQIVVAGLLLLLAAAPRPLTPRDPPLIARRSPLEHADALAQAYAGVNATRTATARLLAGVRRRVRRDRAARDTDEHVLSVAAGMSAEGAKAAALVSSALETPVAARELPRVAEALDTIETVLSRRPTSPTR